MYGELLGMVPIYIGYHKLVHEDGRIPEIGFEYSPDDVRPMGASTGRRLRALARPARALTTRRCPAGTDSSVRGS